MRIKSVNTLSGGEILAEPILTKEKEILIPKGTILKEDYIPVIFSLGIETLMVEDPYEHLEKPNTIINRSRLESIVERVQQLMERHIYHSNKCLYGFEMIANEIVKEISEMPEDVIIDMNERTANLYEHTVMVTLLSTSIARKLRLDRKRQYNVAVGCLLHDIGLRYITTKYVDRNWENADSVDIFEYKKHTILGFSALDEENWIPDISKKMILSHHEKLDRSGFPMHQKNSEMECKIIQTCDSFDCYISGMECQRMTVQDALQKIKKEAGIKFEPKIVDKLVSMIALYPVGTTVKMDNETEGVVISQTVNPETPIILVLNRESENQKHNLMLEKDISILQIV